MVGIYRDSVVISRTDAAAADAEGNATETLTQIAAVRGTLGSPTTKDQDRAGQRGTQLDAALALPWGTTILDGDVVTVTVASTASPVRAKTFDVVDVIPLRTHQRLLLRETE